MIFPGERFHFDIFNRLNWIREQSACVQYAQCTAECQMLIIKIFSNASLLEKAIVNLGNRNFEPNAVFIGMRETGA